MILIVDNEQDIRDLVFEFIKSEFDMTVICSPDGAHALKILECNQNIDLVISDIDMPNLDGLRFLDQATKFSHCPPFLLMTGSKDDAKKAILNSQANAVVNKPLVMSIFLNIFIVKEICSCTM